MYQATDTVGEHIIGSDQDFVDQILSPPVYCSANLQELDGCFKNST